MKRNPKAFYNYVNSKTKTRTGIPPLDAGDGSRAENDIDKAEVLNKYFGSVFTKEGPEELPSFEMRPCKVFFGTWSSTKYKLERS